MTKEQWIKKMGEHNTDKYDAEPKQFQLTLERVKAYQVLYNELWIKIEALLAKDKREHMEEFLTKHPDKKVDAPEEFSWAFAAKVWPEEGTAEDYIVKINGVTHRMTKERFLLYKEPKEVLFVAPKPEGDERNND
jgi:hypothetical protein